MVVVSNHFPVLMVELVKETATFYESFFGMKVVFDADWYVQLRSEGDVPHEIAVMRWDHETVPDAKRAMASGILMSFEVENAEKLYEKADEDFGQRHFITADPHGNMVDVITPIEPSEEYKALYS